MNTKEKSPVEVQLRVINTIFITILSSMLLFFGVVMFFIQKSNYSQNIELDKIFTFFVPLFGLLTMFLSKIFYRQIITKAKGSNDLQKKIAQYRTSKITVWAVVEGACLLSLIAAMLTSNYLYIVVFVFLFGYMFLIKPSKESLIHDMRLNSEESDLILKR